MANLFEHKDRRVVPSWRSFGQTIILGEIDSYQNERILPYIESSIDSYIIDWQFNKTVIHAAELLSAALANSVKDNPIVKDAASFICENADKSTKSQLLLATSILRKSDDPDLSSTSKFVSLDDITEFSNPEIVWHKIRETRSNISLYAYNPIFYVELSRYYSILGQKEKALWAMKSALHLGANNRFVLRSATRLFAHYDEIEYAHDILRRSPLTIFDPWLISAEISIATIRKRTSRNIKKGIELINSKNISPFNFTELASSIATVELLHGSAKKSRELFSKSLISPNDNSLAQIEWASQKDKLLEIDPTSYPVQMNYEALALDYYHNNEFRLALDNAAQWFLDMPFSKRPIMFGSNLASTILKDQKKSISFLKAGLISHPNDPQLINNLAYALALDNNVSEASDHINKIKTGTPLDMVTKICLTATKGLTYFRMGYPDAGRHLYLKAIEETRQINNKELNWIAILNYAREEILARSEYIDQIMEIVNKIPSDPLDIEVKALQEDVFEAYEKFRTNT